MVFAPDRQTCQQGPPHRVLLFDFVATLCMVIDGFCGMPRNRSQLPYGELEGQSGHGKGGPLLSNRLEIDVAILIPQLLKDTGDTTDQPINQSTNQGRLVARY